MSPRLDERAAQLPTTAGVYLFKDRRGRVLYVGKAINLRSRVRQYLGGHDGRPMVPHLVRASHDIDVVLTHTEKEALLLENTLIKKHMPRFNIQFRDDSSYLHLRIDLKSAWPRYRMVRKIDDDGARYFGPFSSAQKARETLAHLSRVFPLRTCSDATLKTRRRPCILHQMHRCTAPCVGLVDKEAYQKVAVDSLSMMEGRSRAVIDQLKGRMLHHADLEEFEEAGRLRDLIASIAATVEKQKVIDPGFADRDVWGIARDGYTVAVAILPVREGVMGEPLARVVSGAVEEDEELLSSWLNGTYVSGSAIPDEILVPTLPTDHAAIEELLSERAGRKIKVHTPARGQKVRLIDLARENAGAKLTQGSDEHTRRQESLTALADAIGLAVPPTRMECFDNSHLGGTDPVAAMAVFVNGRPARAEYRRYKLKVAPGGDDYAGMREVLSRRVKRGLESGDLPDLLVIDGGKGQVAIAMAVLADLGVTDLPVVGISKPRTEHARGDREATDKIVLPNVKDPIKLSAHHPGLRMLQYLRDETHNHVLGFQRKVRNRNTLASALEGIPGVGPTRRRALLRALGSIQGVADADVDTIAAVPGIGPALASTIHAVLSAD